MDWTVRSLLSGSLLKLGLATAVVVSTTLTIAAQAKGPVTASDSVALAELPREQPLLARQAAEYVRDAAEAVHYAHQQGTLQRDLKPSNILIDRQGRVRITDFGLAKRIEAGSELTFTGQILGTPSYMPPEQASGKRAFISAASDIYSLGAVLYELLSGRPPFRGESPAETIWSGAFAS